MSVTLSCSHSVTISVIVQIIIYVPLSTAVYQFRIWKPFHTDGKILSITSECQSIRVLQDERPHIHYEPSTQFKRRIFVRGSAHERRTFGGNRGPRRLGARKPSMSTVGLLLVCNNLWCGSVPAWAQRQIHVEGMAFASNRACKYAVHVGEVGYSWAWVLVHWKN